MSILKPVIGEDEEKVREFHKAQGGREPRRIIYEAFSEEDGVIQGYGGIELSAELILSVNHALTVRKRADTIAALLHMAKKAYSYDMMAFTDEKFAKILNRHFGFELVPETTLILRGTNEQE